MVGVFSLFFFAEVFYTLFDRFAFNQGAE